MCRVLRVNRAGYDAWLKSPDSERAKEDERLLGLIKHHWLASGSVYGHRKIAKDLRDLGERCSRHRVHRLMRADGLRAQVGYGRKPRFHGGMPCKAAANLLDRQFEVTEPDTAWASDFTFIRTHEGWMYLAVVIDLFSRQEVGWAMRDRADTGLVVQALLSAVWRRKPASGFLVHSDQGSVYTSDDWRSFLAFHGLVCIMRRRGNCHEREACPWGTTPRWRASWACSNASGSGNRSISTRTARARRCSTASRCSTTPNAVTVQPATCPLSRLNGATRNAALACLPNPGRVTAPQHNNAHVMKCSTLSLLDGNSANSGGRPRHAAITTTIAVIHKPTHNRGRSNGRNADVTTAT